MAQADGRLGQIRTLGYRLVPPDQLLAHPSNPRRHPAAQREALRASLRALGWVAPILVNVRTQHVLDGHARVEEALSAGVPQVPILEVDLPPEDEPLFLSVYDPITALASYDQASFAALLEDVHTGEAALQEMLSKLAQEMGAVVPDFGAVGIDEQGRLDEKAKVTCPECGHAWTP